MRNEELFEGCTFLKYEKQISVSYQCTYALQDASVWIFEKKFADRLSRNAKEDVIQIAKKGVINLTKLRHPKILSVVHPLEESRESLAFATEPVYVCLANMFHPDVNLPQSVISEIKEHKLFDTEIKHGILQVRPTRECLVMPQHVGCIN